MEICQYERKELLRQVRSWEQANVSRNAERDEAAGALRRLEDQRDALAGQVAALRAALELTKREVDEWVSLLRRAHSVGMRPGWERVQAAIDAALANPSPVAEATAPLASWAADILSAADSERDTGVDFVGVQIPCSEIDELMPAVRRLWAPRKGETGGQDHGT